MTIAAGDLLKIDQDLSKVTQPALDYYMVMAKDSNPPVAITMSNALKKGTKQAISTTGGIENLDCSLYDQFVITATTTTNLVLNLQNITDGDRKTMIFVNRALPDDQEISFTGVDHVIVGENKGMQYTVYTLSSITNYDVITQINTQSTGSLVIGDLAIDYGSISSFEFFNWTINNNICTLEADFRIDMPSTPVVDEYNITLSNFDLNLYNSKIALNNYSDNTAFTASILLTDNNIYVRCLPAPTLGIGGVLDITITQSFRIE